MKLSFFTLPYGKDRTLLKIAEDLKDYGYDAIEICTWPGFQGNPNKLRSENKEELKKELKKLGIEISALGIHQKWLYEDKSKREENIRYVKACVNLAEDLETDTVITSSGPLSKNVSEEEGYKWLVEDFTECTEYAEDVGIYIAIEPHYRAFVLSSDSILTLLEKVSSPNLRVNFDPSHYVFEGLDYRHRLDALKNYVIRAHAKDFVKDLNDRSLPFYPFKPVAAGQGIFDLEDYVYELKKIGYDGYLTVETYVGKAVENVDEASKESAEYMNGLLKRLKIK